MNSQPRPLAKPRPCLRCPPLQEFGPEAGAMVVAAPELLLGGGATWRAALGTLDLLWVQDPRALGRRRPHLLCTDLSAPGCVASRMVLQWWFGLPAAAVYERLPAAAALSPPAELACRLSFAEALGIPVAPAPPAPAEAAAAPAAAGAALSLQLQDVATLPEHRLVQSLGAAAAARSPWAVAAAWEAFKACFQQRPEWAHLLDEAAAESARLQRLLRGA